MKFVDLAKNSRISKLMELTRALRGCQTPYDALMKYCNYLGEAYPRRAHMVLSTRGLPAGQYRVWRLRTDDGVEHCDLRDPWERFDLPVYSGNVLSRVCEDAMPKLVQEIDWAGEGQLADVLAPYHSLMAVPLFNEGLPLNWSVFLTREPTSFVPGDLEDSVNRATLIGSLLDSLYVTRRLALAHAAAEAEVERMARIQRALLPEPIPDIPGLDLAASYVTSTRVGGDLYDFIAPRSDSNGSSTRWCIFIGDASGHGPSAAVAAAIAQATLHACAEQASGPAELLLTINRHICLKRAEGSFVTAFIAFYEPSTRKLTYSSAGHPLPLFPSAADHSQKIFQPAGGLPLGVDPDAVFDEASVELEPGQMMLLYTDGISEARNLEGEMFGEERIGDSLREISGRPDVVIEQLRKSLMEHQGGRRPVDDQTAVAIQVRA
jgi:sigma-B regulation protein RsbU (phosphoserine phosphatase)